MSRDGQAFRKVQVGLFEGGGSRGLLAMADARFDVQLREVPLYGRKYAL